MRITIFILFSMFYSSFAVAQGKTLEIVSKNDSIISVAETIAEKNYKEQYNSNIRKTYINKVYIPKDLEEAFKELTALTDHRAISKFKNGPEEYVIPRLQLGVGRWMLINWNLYQGSRIGHAIKELGVIHPEDQATFILTTYHRHLNQKDLNIPNLVKTLQDTRAEQIKKRKKN